MQLYDVLFYRDLDVPSGKSVSIRGKLPAQLDIVAKASRNAQFIDVEIELLPILPPVRINIIRFEINTTIRADVIVRKIFIEDEAQDRCSYDF